MLQISFLWSRVTRILILRRYLEAMIFFKTRSIAQHGVPRDGQGKEHSLAALQLGRDDATVRRKVLHPRRIPHFT